MSVWLVCLPEALHSVSPWRAGTPLGPVRGMRSGLLSWSATQQPHVRAALGNVGLGRDRKAVPRVEADVALGRGVAVGGEPVGVAARQDRRHHGRAEPAPLERG